MDEQFDNHLKDHIREVFENFEDPSADESWLMLREKFPEKEKDRGIIWLWFGTAAAVLLLLLGIGTWVNLQKDQPQKLSYKPVKTYRPENKSTHKDQQYSDKQQSILQQTDKNTAIAHKVAPGHPVQLTSPSQNNIKLNRNYIKNNGNTIALRKVPANPLTNKPSTNNYTDKNPLADKSPDKDKAVASNTTVANSPAIPKDTTTRSNAPVIADKLPAKPKLLPFSENEMAKDRKATETNKKDDNNKKVEFSLYAATYFNYAKGSNNQLNIGAGITSDIKLTGNLKLSTGIAIAQNSLSYANQLPEQAIQRGNLAMASTILYGGASSASLTSTFGPSVSPMLKNYNAQLIGLDIPMNLKYEFNPQKNNSYVSVGLSSGTFINEAYTYQYAYANAAALAPAAQPQSQTTSSGLGNFYFAKTLNVSFGLGYPMGKTNHLIIEPFLKYPLEGLGSQQIRFGAGGVNLKFDFISPKK